MFADKIIKKFKFNSLDYPDVDLQIRLRTPIFNDFFLGKAEKRYIPFHCLEELIKGNKKMMSKFFYALYGHKKF